jgi:WD40 repeat protein
MTEAALLVLSALLCLGGCQHQPVYPDIGSIYLSTEPQGAEVLIDGVMQRKITPVKIDGVAVGRHRITLRRFNYKSVDLQLEVKPAQTTRIYKQLDEARLTRKDTLDIRSPDIDLLSDDGGFCLSNSDRDYITLAWLSSEGQIVVSRLINAGAPQRLIAGNSRIGKIFVTRTRPDGEEEITAIEILSGRVIRSLRLDGVKYYSTLSVSPDGNLLVAADSLNKKLVLLDTRLCSVIKNIGLSGSPTDVCFDRQNPGIVYVTQALPNQFSMVNLETGQTERSLPAGESPGAIFPDSRGGQIGFSNRSQLTYSLVNLREWTVASSANIITGKYVVSACWSNHDDYVMWAMDYSLGVLYLPNWEQSSKISNYPGPLVKILPAQDSRHLLMLNRIQLVSIEMEF